MTDARGFIKDLPNDDYHKMEGVSKTGLDKIERSPAHYKFREFKDPTRAMAIGSAIHCAILEPDRFGKDYKVTECKARTEKAYKEAKAEFGGEFALTAQEGLKVLGMQESVGNNLEAMQYLTAPGNAELSAVITDPETGITIRCRYDWITDSGVSVDVKKTQDIRKFAKTVFDYRYHVQDAMYSFIYKQITGEDLRFYFLAVEEEKPHSSQMFLLDDTALEIGNYYFRKNLRTYAECVNADKWPHPDCEEGLIELPNWAISQYENDLEVII